MKTAWTRALVPLLLLGLLAVGPPAWADRSRENPAAAERAEPPRGLFYEIDHDGRSAYLFGTIHVGRQDFFPLEPGVSRALAQSDGLLVEIDATQDDAMRTAILRHAVLPEGQRLDAVLTPAERARLDARLDALDIPRAAMRPLKPWMVALTLTMRSVHQDGFEPEFATDLHLIGLARAYDKTVAELESIDAQLGLFDALAPDEQRAFLNETLDALESDERKDETRDLVDAWLAGDARALDRQSRESMRRSPRSASWMRDKLFTERNQRMAARIDRMLTEGRRPFVAVGALHLTGEDGLPALLKKRGYRVRSLYPPRPVPRTPP